MTNISKFKNIILIVTASFSTFSYHYIIERFKGDSETHFYMAIAFGVCILFITFDVLFVIDASILDYAKTKN